ncbi:hypothetical protein ES703_84914 [subsurface metagenome]
MRGVGIDKHDVGLEISHLEGGGYDTDVFAPLEGGKGNSLLQLGVVGLVHQPVGDKGGEAPVIFLEHSHRLFLATGNSESLALGEVDAPVFVGPDGALGDIAFFFEHLYSQGRCPQEQ